jgi:FdhE protein
VVDTGLRARIAAIAEAAPALADDLRLRGTLVEIVDRAEAGPIAIRLPAEIARARLAAGAPLLDQLDLPISATAARLFEQLAVAMLADPAARQPAEAILVAVRDHRLHAEQALGEAIVGHADHLTALARSIGAPVALLDTLADLAVRPVLGEVGQRLRPALALAPWEHGYCPVCGGRPIFGEQTDHGSRLRCGRCATGWAWSLPRCPDCATGRLSVIETLDDPVNGLWRLEACDACQTYLKTAGARRADRLADLLVDDLATWRLDQRAVSRGLTRASDLGYRLEHGEIGGEGLDDD